MGGKTQSITITSEKGRLSDDDIQRMVNGAEEYAEIDKKEKELIESRNNLESYLYNLRNSLSSDLKEKMNSNDYDTLEKNINDALIWLEDNPSLSKEDYDNKQKEIEGIANPILQNVYQQQQSQSSGGDKNMSNNNNDDDFMGEDLDGVDNNDNNT